MIDRSYIGHKTDPVSVLVEPFQIRLFAKAVGETDPIYLNEEAAKSAGYRHILAPPTFAICLTSGETDVMAEWPKMGIEIAKVLHGEQQFEYFGTICAGDTITLQNEITDIFDKKDGAMEFMLTETTATNQQGEVVARLVSTLIQRH